MDRKKVTGSHYGKVSFTEGEVHIQNNKIVDARVVVDMTSITVEDLTDADYNAKLTGHLKSADFFDVENYKQATVSVKKVTDIKEDADGNNVMIEGDLTIKGQTHPVSFPAKVSVTSGKVVARGDFKLTAPNTASVTVRVVSLTTWATKPLTTWWRFPSY